MCQLQSKNVTLIGKDVRGTVARFKVFYFKMQVDPEWMIDYSCLANLTSSTLTIHNQPI